MSRALLVIACLVVGTLARSVPDPSICATKCSGKTSVYKFESGQQYVYEFSSKIKANVVNMTEDSATVSVTGTATIEAKSDCNFLIKLDGVTAEEKYFKGDKEDFSKLLKRVKEIMEEKPMGFGMSNGKVTDVCPAKDDNRFAVNFKKGILSQLQISMDSFNSPAYLTETDVTGSCITEYFVTEDKGSKVKITKRKAIQGCTNRHKYYSDMEGLSFDKPSELQKIGVIDGNYNCNITVEKKGVLQESICKEAHTMLKPQGRDTTMSIDQTLKFKSKEKAKGITIEQDEAALGEGLLFTHEKDKFKHYNVEKEDPVLVLKELCKETKGFYTEKVPGLFVSLIQRLRTKTFKDIDDLYRSISKKNDDICADNLESVVSVFNDAVPWIRSEGGIKFMIQQMKSGDLPQSRAAWSTYLASIRHPSVQMISDLEPLLKDSALFPEVALGTSALIKKYCKRTNRKCLEEPKVTTVLKLIVDPIGTQCSYSDDKLQQVLYSLHAISNVEEFPASWSVTSTLNNCMQNEDLALQVRVSAADAFRNLKCDSFSRQALQNIFKNLSHPTELRMKAYLSLEKCMDESILNNALEVLNTDPESDQVKSFVLSHLKGMAMCKDPAKRDLRNLVLSRKRRLFSAFMKSKAGTGDFRSYSTYFERTFFNKRMGTTSHVDGHLIYAPNSWIPRSARVNLTMDYFGRAVNLMELDVRANRVEDLLEGMFGRGKSDPIPIKDKVILDKLKEIPKDKDPAHVALAVRRFGNEIFYNPSADVKGLANNIRRFNLGRGISKAAEGNLMLQEGMIIIPTVSGFPLELPLESSVAIKGEFKFAYKWDDILIKAKPSIAFRVSAQMRLNAHCTKIGLKAELITAGDRSLSATSKVSILSPSTGDFNWKFTVDPVPRKTNLFKIKTGISLFSGAGVVPQKGVVKPTSDSYCTGDTMQKALGLKYCLKYSFIRLPGQKMPVSFPALAEVTVDPIKGFQFEMEVKRQKGLPSKLRFSAGDGKTKDMLLLDYSNEITEEKISQNLIFKSPLGTYELGGSYGKNKIEGSLKKDDKVKATIKGEYHPKKNNEHFLVKAYAEKKEVALVEFSNKIRGPKSNIHFEVKMEKYMPFNIRATRTISVAKKRGTNVEIKKMRYKMDVGLAKENLYSADALFAVGQQPSESGKMTLKLLWKKGPRTQFKYENEFEISQNKAKSKADPNVAGVVYSASVEQELEGVFDGQKKWKHKIDWTTFLSTDFMRLDLSKPIIAEHSVKVEFNKKKKVDAESILHVDLTNYLKPTFVANCTVKGVMERTKGIRALYIIENNEMKMGEFQLLYKSKSSGFYEMYLRRDNPAPLVHSTVVRFRRPGKFVEVSNSFSDQKHTFMYQQDDQTVAVNSDIKMGKNDMTLEHTILVNKKKYGSGTTTINWMLPKVGLKHSSKKTSGEKIADIDFEGVADVDYQAGKPFDKDFHLEGKVVMAIPRLFKGTRVLDMLMQRKGSTFMNNFIYKGRDDSMYGFKTKSTIESMTFQNLTWVDNLLIYAYGKPDNKPINITCKIAVTTRRNTELGFRLETPYEQLFDFSMIQKRKNINGEQVDNDKGFFLLDWKASNGKVYYYKMKETRTIRYTANGFTLIDNTEEQTKKNGPTVPTKIKLSLNWSPVYDSATYEFMFNSRNFLWLCPITSVNQLISYKVREGKGNLSFMTNWKTKDDKGTPSISLNYTGEMPSDYSKFKSSIDFAYSVRGTVFTSTANFACADQRVVLNLVSSSEVLSGASLKAGLSGPMAAFMNVSATLYGITYKLQKTVVANDLENQRDVSLSWSSQNIPYVARGSAAVTAIFDKKGQKYGGSLYLRYMKHEIARTRVYYMSEEQKSLNLTAEFTIKDVCQVYFGSVTDREPNSIKQSMEGHFIIEPVIAIRMPKSTVDVKMSDSWKEIELNYVCYLNVNTKKYVSTGKKKAVNFELTYWKHEESINGEQLVVILYDRWKTLKLELYVPKELQEYMKFKNFIYEKNLKGNLENDLEKTTVFELAPHVKRIEQTVIYFNGFETDTTKKVKMFGDAIFRVAYILRTDYVDYQRIKFDGRLAKKDDKYRGEIIVDLHIEKHDIVYKDPVVITMEEVKVTGKMKEVKAKLKGNNLDYELEYEGEFNSMTDFSHELTIEGENSESKLAVSFKNMKLKVFADVPSIFTVDIKGETDATNKASGSALVKFQEKEVIKMDVSVEHTGAPWTWKNFKHTLTVSYTPFEEDSKKKTFSYMAVMKSTPSKRITEGLNCDLTVELEVPVDAFQKLKLQKKSDGIPESFTSSFDIYADGSNVAKFNFDFDWTEKKLFSLKGDIPPFTTKGQLYILHDLKDATALNLEYNLNSFTIRQQHKAPFETTFKLVVPTWKKSTSMKTNVVHLIAYILERTTFIALPIPVKSFPSKVYFTKDTISITVKLSEQWDDYTINVKIPDLISNLEAKLKVAYTNPEYGIKGTIKGQIELEFEAKYFRQPDNFHRVLVSYSYDKGSVQKLTDAGLRISPVKVSYLNTQSYKMGLTTKHAFGYDHSLMRYTHTFTYVNNFNQTLFNTTADCMAESMYACMGSGCQLTIDTPFRAVSLVRTCEVKDDRENSYTELYWNKRRDQGFAFDISYSFIIPFDAVVKAKTPLRKLEFSSKMIKPEEKYRFNLKTSDYDNTPAKTATFQVDSEYKPGDASLKVSSSLLKKGHLLRLKDIRTGEPGQGQVEASATEEGSKEPFANMTLKYNVVPFRSFSFNFTGFMGTQSLDAKTHWTRSPKRIAFAHECNFNNGEERRYFSFEHEPYKLIRITNKKDMLIELMIDTKPIGGAVTNWNITFIPEGISFYKFTRFSKNPFAFYNRITTSKEDITMNYRKTSRRSFVGEMYHQVDGETVVDERLSVRLDRQNMLYTNYYLNPKIFDYYRSVVNRICSAGYPIKILMTRSLQIQEAVMGSVNRFVGAHASCKPIRPLLDFQNQIFNEWESVGTSIQMAYRQDEFYMKTIFGPALEYKDAGMKPFEGADIKEFMESKPFEYLSSIEPPRIFDINRVKSCFKRILETIPKVRKSLRGIAVKMTNRANKWKAKMREIFMFTKSDGEPSELAKYLKSLPQSLKDTMKEIGQSYMETMPKDMKNFAVNLISVLEDTSQFRERYRSMVKYMRKYMMRKYGPRAEKIETMKRLLKMDFVGAYDTFFQPKKFKLKYNLNAIRIEHEMFVPYGLKRVMKALNKAKMVVFGGVSNAMRVGLPRNFGPLFYRLDYLKQNYGSPNQMRKAFPPYKKEAWGVNKHHIITFNMNDYTVLCKRCKYIYAVDIRDKSFALVSDVEGKKKERVYKFTDCGITVGINSETGEVMLGKSGEKGKKVSLPNQVSGCLGVERRGQEVSVTSYYSSITFSVYLNLEAFRLVIPPSMFGRVYGLLGRNSNDAIEGKRCPKSGTAMSSDSVRDFWKINKAVWESYEYKSSENRFRCLDFTRTILSPLNRCFFRIDPSAYYRVCNYEMIAFNDINLCKLKAAFSLRCYQAGIISRVPYSCGKP